MTANPNDPELEKLLDDILKKFDSWQLNGRNARDVIWYDLETPIKKMIKDFRESRNPAPELKIDNRPKSCRDRLRDEGKAYPKSGCAHCINGGLTGCPFDKE